MQWFQIHYQHTALRKVPVRVDKHNDQYNDYNVAGCPRFVHACFLAKIILIVFTAEMGLCR
jgi:hypothetical protein